MSFFSELLQQTAIERDRFLQIPVLQRAATGDIDLPTYRSFLAEAYHHVNQTVPLLMGCGARLPERLEWLRTAVGEYIEEEMGHQEWILNDLRACGVDAAAVRAGSPSFPTEMMIAYAWDTIQRGNPVGFFGMVLVLEGTSIQLALKAAAAIEENLALPTRAFSYLRSHGIADEKHMGTFEGLMDRIDDKADQAAIVHVANRMYRLYGGLFRDLETLAEQTRVAA